MSRLLYHEKHLNIRNYINNIPEKYIITEVKWVEYSIMFQIELHGSQNNNKGKTKALEYHYAHKLAHLGLLLD